MSALSIENEPAWTWRTAVSEDLLPVDEFLRGLSLQTAYRRFFVGGKPSLLQVRGLVEVDHDRRETLLVFRGTHVVGAATYARVSRGLAEISVVVGDEWQHLGLGTRLTRQVIRLAGARGIEAVRATVLSENRRVLDWLRRYWPQVRPERSAEGGVVEYVLPVRGPGAPSPAW